MPTFRQNSADRKDSDDILPLGIPLIKCVEQQKRINEKFKIGINISGLLWSGGYTMNNQFDLSVDYKNSSIPVKRIV